MCWCIALEKHIERWHSSLKRKMKDNSVEAGEETLCHIENGISSSYICGV
jgi:hypothetical protein